MALWFSVRIIALASASPQLVLTKRDGSIINATPPLQHFVFGNDMALPDVDGKKMISFALSHDGGWTKTRHGVGDYGCQGSLVGEKLISFFDNQIDANVKTAYNPVWFIRSQLLSIPVTPSGKMFNSEDYEYHVSWAGAFEASAEAILLARTYAAHTGDTSVFTTNPERLVCYESASGDVKLAGVQQPGMNSSICSIPPAKLVGYASANIGTTGNDMGGLFIDHFNAPFQHMKQLAFQSHGKALVALEIHFPESFSQVRLPLVAKNARHPQYPFSVVLKDNDGAILSSSRINVSNPLPQKTWLVLEAARGSTFAPGVYTILVTPERAVPAHSPIKDWARQSYYYGAGWVTNAYPASSGSAYHGLFTCNPSDRMWHVGMALHEKLPLAMDWQLDHSLRATGQYGLFLIGAALSNKHITRDEMRYRGSPSSATLDASAWYDQFKIGWKSTYINLLFLRSIDAYLELQEAGLLPANATGRHFSVPLRKVRVAVADDIERQLISPAVANSSGGGSGRDSDSTVVSWIYCNSTGPDCDAASKNGTNQSSVSLGMLADYGMAASLFPHRSDVRRALHKVINASRISAGLFRTSSVPIESVSPRLFCPSDKWHFVDAEGFALRIANQSGDWHIFREGDGYGSFGLHQQNGGSLMSTGAFAAMAGPYGNSHLEDFEGIATTLSAIREAIINNDTAKPLASGLLPEQRLALRAPVVAPLVKRLCVSARSHNPAAHINASDWWGAKQCDYYNSNQFDLPSNGALLFRLAKGFLRLEIPVPRATRANGGDQVAVVSVFGTPLHVDAGSVQVPVPAEERRLWPDTLRTVSIGGLAVAGRSTMLSCTIVEPALGASAEGNMDEIQTSLSCALRLADRA